MKIDLVLSFDQELAWPERRSLHFTHGLDLPGPDGVLEIIPAAPGSWHGQRLEALGIHPDQLVEAQTILFIAQSGSDLLEIERTFLLATQSAVGAWVSMGPTQALQHGRWFAVAELERFNKQELAHLGPLGSEP